MHIGCCCCWRKKEGLGLMVWCEGELEAVTAIVVVVVCVYDLADTDTESSVEREIRRGFLICYDKRGDTGL